MVKTLCLILLHPFEEGKPLHKGASFEVLRKAWLKAVVFEFIYDFSSLDKSVLPHELVLNLVFRLAAHHWEFGWVLEKVWQLIHYPDYSLYVFTF